MDSIHIPSILLKKEDYENFERVSDGLRKQNKHITLAVNFPLNKIHDVAIIKMILQVDDYRSYDAITAISDYYEAF